ncbi:DUF805 domain-containing protein [Klebsiella oxytoca]|uniref:DUF805 domain-containing protein n=1 Tax=Klebsiella oxytoca TaxID=571 RepID=A0A6B8MP08_KLEOX|nr:DUF805 domain-containing protein [Klebsiella oxytoca]QGN36509.1 DUF805 domain-containing protein [Klebsiella oxytoca]
MAYGEAYLKGWKNAFNFSGVASRLEFWSFFITNLLVLALPLAACLLAMQYRYQYGVLLFYAVPLSFILLLVMIVPVLAVGCRRMHDIGRSGWWFALCLIIPWFLIVALWLCCLRSAPSSR